KDSAGNQITVAYNAGGKPAQVRYPGNLTTDLVYDSLNRLIDVVHRKNGTTVAEYAYTLGPRGERLQVRESTGRQIDYAYDAVGRLIREAVAIGGATTAT